MHSVLLDIEFIAVLPVIALFIKVLAAIQRYSKLFSVTVSADLARCLTILQRTYEQFEHTQKLNRAKNSHCLK